MQNNICFANTTEVGKKILGFVVNDAPRVSFAHNCYYHSRMWETNQKNPYQEEQMWEAPFGYASPGRYSWCGMGNFYFANTEKGTFQEMKNHHRNGTLQVAKIVSISPISMIDLTCDIKGCQTFLNNIRSSAQGNQKVPNEYLIPSYVADCCKFANIGGIKYYGGKDYNNYVTWNHSYFEIKSMKCYKDSDWK